MPPPAGICTVTFRHVPVGPRPTARLYPQPAAHCAGRGHRPPSQAPLPASLTQRVNMPRNTALSAPRPPGAAREAVPRRSRTAPPVRVTHRLCAAYQARERRYSALCRDWSIPHPHISCPGSPIAHLASASREPSPGNSYRYGSFRSGSSKHALFEPQALCLPKQPPARFFTHRPISKSLFPTSHTASRIRLPARSRGDRAFPPPPLPYTHTPTHPYSHTPCCHPICVHLRFQTPPDLCVLCVSAVKPPILHRAAHAIIPPP
jgi:hypothetical protein